jgi:type VI secretion system secreted protein Hcp
MTPKLMLAALLLAAGPFLALRAFAADAFLKLDGVEGESTHQDHKGEIELDAFQLTSLRGAAERASQSSGAGAGKITFNPFTITRKVDRASPKIAQACVTGKHFQTATIAMRKAGGSQQEYFVFKLQGVTVSAYRTSGAGAGATETFTVNAADATLEHPAVPTPRPKPAGPAVTTAGPTVKK